MRKQSKSTYKEDKRMNNTNKRAKGDKYSKKDKQTGSIRESNGDKLSSLNDVSWYSRFPELLEAAARIPFPNKPGMTVSQGELLFLKSGSQELQVFGRSTEIPGVMAINFIPAIGRSTDVTSPASIAAKEMYGRIRARFSGSLDEDAPDLMMYTLALDSIQCYIAALKRLYRTVNLFTPFNRDYPEVALAAMAGNASESWMIQLRSDMPKFWSYINQLVHMANKFLVPEDMDLFARHRWMNENIYLDEPAAESQSYIFVQKSFWKIDDTGETGTALVPVLMPAAAGSLTADSLFELGKGMITALSDWDDAYTINGHIERAYEGSKFYQSPLIAQDEVIVPVYQYEVLTQIENLGCVDVDLTTIGVTQDPDTNAIIFNPKTTSTTAHKATFSRRLFMNMHEQNPSVASIAVASRLQATLHDDNDNGTHIRVADAEVDCGTEIPISITLYNRAGESYTVYWNSISTLGDVSATNVRKVIGAIIEFGWYSHSPLIYVSDMSTGTSAMSEASCRMWPMCDLANFTSYTKDLMENLHRVCVYSEFNCFR
jgi:hypothetical protein